MPETVTVCRESDVQEGKMIGVDAKGKHLILVKVDGKVSCLDGICPHKGAALEDGECSGGVISCPLHHSQFKAGDGSLVAGPAKTGLKKYEVKIENGEVKVSL